MKQVYISYIVIGVFILVVVCYQFFGSDYVSVLHALIKSSVLPDNYTDTIHCKIEEVTVKEVPQLPDLLVHNQLNQPLLFPFPKVAYYHSNRVSDANGAARLFYLHFQPNYVVNINANSKTFDSRLSNIVLDRFCAQSKSFISINSTDVELLTISEINISITDLKGHPDVVFPGLLNQQSAYQRHLSELLLDDSLVIQHEDDEFYEITLSTLSTSTGSSGSGSIKIQCNTEKGLLLALSTLNQLLASTLPLQLPLTIIDWPDNNWRGFLVDVSRHFTPVSLLKRTLNAMEASKLNILHFHLTDAQSFPLLLDDVTVPDTSSTTAAAGKGSTKQQRSQVVLPLSKLARNSAFSPQKIYSKDDIREVLQHAYERGITVIPEIDMPAHAHSWSKAFDHILVNCSGVARRSQTPLNIYPLDPSQPLTWVLVEQVLLQVVDLFDQSPYLHVGGDEVDEACWAESPRVVQWAKDRGIPLREVTKYFEQEVFKVVYRLGRVPMVWQGILDGHQMPAPSSYLPGYELLEQQTKKNTTSSSSSSGSNGSGSSKSKSSGTPSSSVSGVAHSTLSKNEVKDKYTRNASLTHISNSSINTVADGGAAVKIGKIANSGNSSAKGVAVKSPVSTEHKKNQSTIVLPKDTQKPPSLSTINTKGNSSSGIKNSTTSARRLASSAATATPATAVPLTFAPPVVEPWKCWDGLAVRSGVSAVQEGHPMLMSACYYLDYNQDWSTYLAADLTSTSRAIAAQPVAGSNASSASAAVLTQRFSYSPSGGLHQLTPAEVAAVGPVSAQDMFLGGEATMFAELIDHTNFECRLHPRLGAVAARLWGLGSQFISVAYTAKHSTSSSASDSATTASLRKKPTPSRMVANPGHQSMQLSLDQSRLLYMSFIQYRFYLASELKVKASPLLFHYSKPQPPAKKSSPTSSSVNGSRPITAMPLSYSSAVVDDYPEEMNDVVEALRRAALLSQPMQLSTNDRSYNQIQEGSFRITAQCRGMPEPIQRPLTSKVIGFAQVNIANGGSTAATSTTTTTTVGSRLSASQSVSRSAKLADWLTLHANKGTLFIGFNELNGWEELHSRTELMKNRPKMVLTASASGFTYSHVMSSSLVHPYSLGLVAALPFTVVKEYKASTTTGKFSRGVLHTYFPPLDLHVLVLHLSPKSAAVRLQEVTQLLEIVRPLLESSGRVVLMGDFNTLSPYDKRQHDADDLTTMFKRTDHETFKHFGNKYLNSKKDAIDYSPMEKLLSANFSDFCVERCIAASKIPVTGSVADKIKNHQWQINATSSDSSAFTSCMRTYCPFTEPTLYNPEWPFKDASHPRIRVDFILVSESLLRPSTTDDSSSSSSSSNSLVESGGVDISELTSGMSDHYPVYAALRDSLSREFELFRKV